MGNHHGNREAMEFIQQHARSTTTLRTSESQALAWARPRSVVAASERRVRAGTRRPLRRPPPGRGPCRPAPSPIQTHGTMFCTSGAHLQANRSELVRDMQPCSTLQAVRLRKCIGSNEWTSVAAAGGELPGQAGLAGRAWHMAARRACNKAATDTSTRASGLDAARRRATACSRCRADTDRCSACGARAAASTAATQSAKNSCPTPAAKRP